MYEHPRWLNVKKVVEQLNKYPDNALVFIQPHKFMIDYPFYIYQSGDNIYFRFYDDMLLKEPIKGQIQNIKERLKGIIRKVKNGTQ